MVYVVSDSVGETAEMVTRAAVSQFNHGQLEIRRVPYLNEPEDVREIVEEAAGFPSIIVFTLVQPNLREILVQEAATRNIKAVDVMGPLIEAMGTITTNAPRLEPGLVRKVDEEYFRRVEAIEFAVKYDDGKDPRGILQADLVVLGVSRTGKTPLCMYLAHKRIKVANIPLVPEVAPPDEIFTLPPHRLIGLNVNPQQLVEIRRERLKALGLPADAGYASTERVLKELAHARKIFQRSGCSVIDVTNRAVEETAGKVLEIYHKGERYRSE